MHHYKYATILLETNKMTQQAYSAMLAIVMIAVLPFLVSAAWVPPVKFEEQGILHSMYTDPANGYTYFQYVIPEMEHKGYCSWGVRRMSPDKKLDKFVILRRGNDHITTVLFPGDIKGSGDGAHLFSVQQAFRPTYTNFLGLEVVFQESVDQGNTWTAPAYIQRKNMTDRVTRYYPRVLYVKETGRLYIFYIAIKIGTEPHTGTAFISSATRAPGSKVLSDERMLFEIKNADLATMIPQMNVAYTYVSGKLLLHLVWTGENDKIFHAYSGNAGITWSQPAVLGQTITYPGVATRMISFNSEPSLGQLLVTFHAPNNVGYITESRDSGATWSKPTNFTTDDNVLWGFGTVRCGGMVWIGHTEGTGKLMFQVYDPSKKTIESKATVDFQQPESELSKPCFTCMAKEGKFALVAGNTLGIIADTPIPLFYSYNDDA